MKPVKTHKDLDVWKISMSLCIDLYRITGTFPVHEKFGLASQVRRAAVSVCCNIAEGAARGHPKEFIQFLYVALGSVSELETQMEIAVLLGYVSSIAGEAHAMERLRKMLVSLIRAMKQKTAR